MSLQEFRDLLLGITEKAYHFEAAQDAPDKYIVWQETGSRALLASDCRQEVIHELRVDFYPEEEYDPMPEQRPAPPASCSPGPWRRPGSRFRSRRLYMTRIPAESVTA